MLFKRGRIWWFRIKLAGTVIRESTRTSSKPLARRVERQRLHKLEEGFHQLPTRHAPMTFAAAAAQWMQSRAPVWSPKTLRAEHINLAHLKPVLGHLFLGSITPEHIADYQRIRLAEGAAPKTINLEIGSVRAILRRHRLWANLQPDIRLLSVPDIHGKALSEREEQALLRACADSRSHAILPAVVIAINTGMRYREILQLQWHDVDLVARRVRVRHSKTQAGRGRVIPLNQPCVCGAGVPEWSMCATAAGALRLRLRALWHRGRCRRRVCLCDAPHTTDQEREGGVGKRQATRWCDVPVS